MPEGRFCYKTFMIMRYFRECTKYRFFLSQKSNFFYKKYICTTLKLKILLSKFYLFYHITQLVNTALRINMYKTRSFHSIKYRLRHNEQNMENGIKYEELRKS